MPPHVYSEINLHLTWHVKRSLPIIRAEIEPRLHKYIRSYALQSKGVIFYAIGGIETHVHIVVSVPPTLVVADWIGRVKGASAHYVNHRIANRKLLEWQTGYGVVSFGTKDLEWVVKYVRNQKEHHANGTTALRLESIGDESESGFQQGR